MDLINKINLPVDVFSIAFPENLACMCRVLGKKC